MMHLFPPVGAERRRGADRAVEHIFDGCAAAAVKILCDDHQLVCLADDPADLL